MPAPKKINYCVISTRSAAPIGFIAADHSHGFIKDNASI